jgi:hypothetical protein
VKITVTWDVASCSLVHVYRLLYERSASIFRTEDSNESGKWNGCRTTAGSDEGLQHGKESKESVSVRRLSSSETSVHLATGRHKTVYSNLHV